jgi:outer membrane protein TolC
LRPTAASMFALGFSIWILLLVPRAASAQQPQPSALSLQQAVSIAMEKNPQRKMALADTKVAEAELNQARSFLLPHAAFSETATTGNDPVYVFGSKLRQQRFTTGDFALNVLNTPQPYGNFDTRFGGSWNLFDSFASWHGVTRAERNKDASAQQLDRTDQQIVFGVINSYYDVLLAKKELEVAQQAVTMAEAILDRSNNRVESGLAVQSDSLSAQVRMAQRQQDLIRSRDNLALSRAELTLAMGVASDNEFDAAETLEERGLPAVSLEDLEKQAMDKRPDLRSLRSREAAQQQSVSMAKSSFGPRVNAFGGWEADNPTFLAGGGGNSWLAGIEVQVDLFQGGAKRAQLASERALAEKIAATREGATDAIRLEVRKAYYDLDASRQQIEVSRASIAESRESLRINQNRYDSGLITITDLLAAEEAARRSEADYWEAVYRTYIGYANLELASGTLSAQSAVVLP